MGLFSKKKTSSSKLRFTLFDENVPFQVTEAYKTLRTNIVMALATQRAKTFAVSSANAGEGKSTTAANLAIVFSQAGKKVLLIDADLRKPVQHRAFFAPRYKDRSPKACEVFEKFSAMADTCAKWLHEDESV